MEGLNFSGGAGEGSRIKPWEPAVGEGGVRGADDPVPVAALEEAPGVTSAAR